jgi:transposase
VNCTSCLHLLTRFCFVCFVLSRSVACFLSLFQRHCEKCGEALSRALIKASNKRHKSCRSFQPISSSLTFIAIPTTVVSPVTPAVVPSLLRFSSSSSAPSRSHHSSKVISLCPCVPVCILTSGGFVLTSHVIVLVCFVLPCTACCQERCSLCNRWLSHSIITAHIHLCDACRGPHISAPPSSPLSSPEPSPASAPLFDRELHSHLPLSPIERSAAVVLTRIGETQTEAATKLGTTRQTVAHWHHHFEEKRDLKDALRSGRPRETTEEVDIDVVATSVIDHRRTPKQIREELDLDVSARTIDRRLQEAGLFGRVALKKKAFDEEEKKQRLSFAEGYKSWSEEDWERVIFADEAIIKGVGGVKGGRQWIRRSAGNIEAFKSENVHHQLPHPKQINVWACFSSVGPGYCYIYNETLNATRFVNILKTHLLASADLLFTETPRQQWWFLQDNAPTHKALVTRAFLHNHGITCLDFPPYSPDLNPIENLWQHIEKRVEERGPNTIEALQDVIAEEWTKTPRELLIKLAHSMHKRCLDVVAASGDHIHF